MAFSILVQPPEPRPERPDHILIVDDDLEIRQLLATYLGRNGWKTSTVGDGRGMWRALQAGGIDLVVLDLMLPGDDGLTLCRQLRASSELPVRASAGGPP